MDDKKLSILIIVKGRKNHLLNVLAAIEQSTRTPYDLVIVHMNEPEYPIDSQLPIRQDSLSTTNPLPLAAARNRAASLAKGTMLLFLDVDCIPAPTCIEDLLAATGQGMITMADPLYLPDTVTSINFTAFERSAAASKARHNIAYGISDQYELFWSLGFMVSKQTFEAMGGFDESFTGYGGEDTDFAFTAQSKQIPLAFSRARIYHQPHPSYDPPLNWLEDIVTNARTFKGKWGIWPMRGWLQSFESAGYISLTDTSIEIQRLPTTSEVEHAQRL